MKKKNKIILISILCVGVATMSFQTKEAHAYDFASDEAGYASQCNGYIGPNDGRREMCRQFQNYLQNKLNAANKNVSGLQSRIDALGSDLDALKVEANKIGVQKEAINANIKIIEETLNTITAGIEKAEIAILKKETAIDARRDVIKERMLKLQVKANTNQYIDYVMGATDLVDLVQRASSIESFTGYDKDLIKKLNTEMKELEAEKVEKERLKETQLLQKQNLEVSVNELQQLEEANNRLAGIYAETQKALIQERNEAIRQANIASGKIDKIIITDDIIENIPSTDGLIHPVPTGYRSAGTWAYPGGGYHIGLDRATNIGSPVYAPANAIILSANVGQPGTGGTGNNLGTLTGNPAGGGNTICLLVSVSGVTYAMNFYHLSSNLQVSAGQRVAQGQVIAYTGNTGNSTGPHCHIEVLRINGGLDYALNYWNARNDWAWGNNWSTAASCSTVACRIRPESLGW